MKVLKQMRTLSVIEAAYTDLCDEINILIEEYSKITK